MMNFLDVFDVYSFLVRDSLVIVLLGLSIYVMLNAGLFALPQAGTMAIGAYCAALPSVERSWPVPLTLLAALVGGTVAGVLLGGVLSRLNGIYLAIATIGFGEIVRVVIRNVDSFGGAVGLVGIDRSINDLEIVGGVAAAVIGLLLLNRTRVGPALRAMREDPLMTVHQGVNARRYRLALFGLSGALAGLAGGMQVHLTGFVQPEAFNFDLLITALLIVVLGGSGVVAGPLVGGAIVFGLGEVFREFAEFQHLLNAVLIVLVVAVLPEGVAPALGSMPRSLYRKLWPKPPSTDEDRRKFHGTLAGSHEVAATAQRRDLIHGTEPMLTVSGLSKRFGGVHAVKSVDLVINQGEILGIIGPNGSGKTTFLNLLSGVYAPDSGTGVMLGSDLRRHWGRPDRMARAGISRTFQSIRLIDDWTVRQNVELGAYLQSRHGHDGGSEKNTNTRKEVQRLVDTAMARVGVLELGSRSVDSLPYGLRRKVEIARAMVHVPSVLLLDEPTAGMSPDERDEIFRLVRSLRSEGITVVVVEHDVESITRYCDRIAVLCFGELLALGTPAEVVAKEEVIHAYIGRGARR